MKPSLAILLFPALSAASLPWLWQSVETAQHLLQNPLCRSRVPQFLLDTNHPWIAANRARLERLPDAESFLCSHDVFFSPLPEDRPAAASLEPPPDLFDALRIGNDSPGDRDPVGWSGALARFREMGPVPAALARARELCVDLRVWDPSSAAAGGAGERPPPPAELVSLSGEVLGALPRLETLRWDVPGELARYFEAGLAPTGDGDGGGGDRRATAPALSLPSVRRLEPGSRSHFLVQLCPNLEVLENGGGRQWQPWGRVEDGDPGVLLIREAASARGLTRFAMDAGYMGWSVSLVQEVWKAMPNIESLGLGGRLGREDRYSWREHDDPVLKKVLRALSSFEKLTHLDLPPTWELQLGWDGGPWCGNAYDGPEGREYQRQVVREGAEAQELAASMVLEMLPNLTGLSIGGIHLNLTRAENGSVSVLWPWAGGMDEWVMEKVPREWDYL